MKHYLFIALFFCFSGLFSQEDIFITSKQSEVFKDKKKHTQLLYTEADGDGGFITVRVYYGGLLKMPKGYYIDHYNKDLKLIKEYDLEIENSELKGIKVEDNTLTLLESQLDKDNDVYQFNVLQTSLSEFDFQKTTLLSFSEDDIKKYFGVGIGIFFINNGLAQMDSGGMGDVTFSKNKNFFCVNWDIKDKDNQTQRLYVFDKNFEKVYEKEFKRNVKDRLFDYENIDVDDTTGEVFLLGKVYENNTRASKKKGKANYHYELHKISPDDQQNVSFKTDANFARSLSTLRTDNAIVCVGFYSEKKDNRYKGVCHFTIDPNTFELKSKKFSPFTEDFIKDKYGKVKDKELSSLRYRSIFLDANDNIIINAEEYYTRTRTMNSMNGGMTTYTTYHFNDIVSVKMDPSGDLMWARNINKRQVSSGGTIEYLSFSATTYNDETYIFINCSDKVRKLRNDRIEFKQTKSKKSNLYAIKIDPEGNYSYQSIIDDKDAEVPFFVSQGIRTNSFGNEMVFLGRRKSKKQFLKLNIK